MSQQKEIALFLRNSEDAQQDGTLSLTQYSPADRYRRAGAALGVCWLLGGILLFPVIPILHIFLSAACWITGPALFYLRIKQDNQKHTAQGICPSCTQAITLELDNAEPLPQWNHCPACHLSVQLVAKSPSEVQ